MLKKQPGGTVLSCPDAVAGALKDLGRERITSGAFIHDIQQGFFALFPNWLVGNFIFKQTQKIYARIMKRQAEQEAKAKKEL